MGWASKLGGALLDCISKPVDVLCDWASEPLKRRSHDRSEASKASAHKREMDSINAQAKSDSEIKMKEMKLESELLARERQQRASQDKLAHENKLKEMELASNLSSMEKELEVDLEVRRVREIETAVAEIQEWKKEKEFERMERTTAAIAHYLEQLTKLNVETISAIGHMQLELKERAQQLVYDKTIQYKELQDNAIEDAMNDFLRIEEKFAGNERAQDILIRAVDTKMGNIIDTSTRFLEELNRDIVSLNESIDRLTNQGQKFIENHLERFHIADRNSSVSLSDATVSNTEIPSLKDIN